MIINGWSRYHAGQIAISALHTNTDTEVTIGYNPQTLPAGYTDKFYVGGVTLKSTNLATEIAAGRAFLAGSNTNNGATNVSLSGLEHGKWYAVIGHRYDDAGQATAVYSNQEIINTARMSLDEFPANGTVTFDPASDAFLDWFMPFRDGAVMTFERGNDGTMGDYLRIKNTQNYLSYCPYLMFDGLKYMSSRYDWSLKYKARHHSTGQNQQVRFGFTAGDQCSIAWEVFRPHEVQSDEVTVLPDETWPVGYDDKADVEYGWPAEGYLVGKAFATHRLDLITSGTQNIRGWLSKPKVGRTDNLDDTWSVSQDAIFTIEFVFTAAADKLEIKLNDVVVMTFDDVQELVSKRIKWPVGEEFPMPISPYMRFQLLNSTSDFVDIGEITMSSSCPYDMACLVGASGEEQSINGVAAYGPAQLINPDSQLQSMCWVECHTESRFSVNRHTGYTLAGNSGGGYFTHDEGVIWTNGETGVFKMLPVVANGRVLRKLKWIGYPNAGTVQGRLLNADTGAALNSYANITGATGQATLDAPTTTPENIIPQVSFAYTGATGTITAEPYSPSKILAVELYFGTVNAERSDNTVTITAWDEATIYYKLDDGDFTIYSAPVDVTNKISITYYAVEGSYQTSQKLLILSREDFTGLPVTRTDHNGNPVIRTPLTQ